MFFMIITLKVIFAKNLTWKLFKVHNNKDMLPASKSENKYLFYDPPLPLSR